MNTIKKIIGYRLSIQLTDGKEISVPHCVNFDDESCTDKMLICFADNDELRVYKANIVYYTVAFLYEDDGE